MDRRIKGFGVMRYENGNGNGNGTVGVHGALSWRGWVGSRSRGEEFFGTLYLQMLSSVCQASSLRAIRTGV